MAKNTYNYGIPSYCEVVDFESEDTVKRLANVFARQAYVRINSLFKYTGLPDTVDPEYFGLWLQFYGYVVLKDLKEADITINRELYKPGVYAFSSQGVGLGGEPDPNYRPTLAIITNPALGLSTTSHIGTECALIRNDPLFMGLKPFIDVYATMLAESTVTLRMTDIIARMPWLINAEDDNTAKSAIKVLDDLKKGKIGISTSQMNLDEDHITSHEFGTGSTRFTDLIEYHQYLKASLFHDLGINANFNMKREALNSAESSMNIQALIPFIDTMYKTQKADLEKCNELLGTNIGIEYSSVWQETQKLAEVTPEELTQDSIEKHRQRSGRGDEK